MTKYDNTNRGSIWKNEKKETDKHPDFTGSINVEGVEYWLSGWKRNEGASPKSPAMSFSIKRKAARQELSSAPVKPRATASADMDDEIPFAPEFR